MPDLPWFCLPVDVLAFGERYAADGQSSSQDSACRSAAHKIEHLVNLATSALLQLPQHAQRCQPLESSAIHCKDADAAARYRR